MNADSDIDLAFYPTKRGSTRSFLDALMNISDRSPVALDGEFVLPNGWGVSWKELARAPETMHEAVLVKTDAGPLMAPVKDVWEVLRD